MPHAQDQMPDLAGPLHRQRWPAWLAGCLTGALLHASPGIAGLLTAKHRWLLCHCCASGLPSLLCSAWWTAVTPCCRCALSTPSGLWSWRPASSGQPTPRSFRDASVQSVWSPCTTVTTTHTPGACPGGVLELVAAALSPVLCPRGVRGCSLAVCAPGAAPASGICSKGGSVPAYYNLGSVQEAWPFDCSTSSA